MMIPHMRHLALILLLLAPLPALAQTPGTLNLSGPSTGGPVVTTATINAAVNAQLGAKANVANPVFTGTLTAAAGALSGTLTLGAGGTGSQQIIGSGTGNMVFQLGGASSVYNFRNNLGVSSLQVGGSSNSVAVQHQITLPGNVWDGTGNLFSNSAIFSNSNWTGNTGASTGSISLNQIQMSDNIVTNPNQHVTGLTVVQSTNTPNYNGGRHAAQFIINLNSAGAGSPGDPANSAAVNAFALASANSGGTGTTQELKAGALFGLNPVATLLSGATNWGGVNGMEIDYGANAGSSVMDKAGLNVALGDTGGVLGSRDNIGIQIIAGYPQGSGPGMNSALNFGSAAGSFPINATGKLIEATRLGFSSGGTAAGTGIDFLSVAFSKWLIISNGFSVDGSGTQQIGTGIIGATGTGLKVDAAGAVGTGTPAVSAAGTGFMVRNVVEDAFGGIYNVATLTGTVGAVATVTVLRQPFVPSGGSIPSNPVAVTLYRDGTASGRTAPYDLTQWASGLTLNLTWDTTKNAVSIQPTAGGKLSFNGATPIVKATPSGACAGNTGCQALRDALGNLGLINTGSITN